MQNDSINKCNPFSYKPTEALTEKCFDALQREGFFCLENAIPTEHLNAFQKEITNLVKKHGERYFSIINPCKEAGSAFQPLYDSEDFYSLLRALSSKAAGQKSIESEAKPYNVLRVVSGPKGTEKSLMFHFDATVVTALIPILIPEGAPDEAGDLVVSPNLRKIRRSTLLNLLEKAVFQNSLARLIASKVLLRNGKKTNIRRLEPGNIYIFWGYRTLHANLSVRPNAIRSTLIFHVGDPHPSSQITKFILKLRKYRETVGVKR